MGNNIKNQHYKNMDIRPQMLMYPFEAETAAYNIWIYYGDWRSERILAYAVEVDRFGRREGDRKPVSA